jgi:tRNA-dihydrouridine synthase A
MQGYTNAQTRKMFHLLSPSSVKWTEMEKLDDIFPKTESDDYLFDALEKRLGPPDKYYDPKNNDSDEANLVLQLGTNDPQRLRAFVEHTMERYDNIKEINLNCGCPAIESGGASTYGASLMKDARLTGQLVEAARNGLEKIKSAKRPYPDISVKCRIGVFESDNDMRPLEDSDHEYLKDYVSAIHKNGANHVILHARPAILSGLSPVKNRIVPKLDYGFVERIAAEFEGKMDVTLNGGITSLSQLRSLQKNSSGSSSTISSYMAGRWCLRRPLDLMDVEDLLKEEEWESTTTGSSFSSSLPLIQNAIEQYLDDAIRIASDSSSRTHKPTLAELCLPLFLITEQLKDDYDYEEDEMQEDGSLAERPILTYDDIESLYDVLQDGVAQIEEVSNSGKKKKKKQGEIINFKRLSSSFKSLVGTKVVNKWKRNRAEL